MSRQPFSRAIACRLRPLRRPLARFARDTQGTITIESVIFLPILLWIVMMTFVFFDVFRNENTNAKAAYAVADILSRQVTPVDADYLDGLGDVYAALARARHPTSLRVSSIDFDSGNDEYRLRWSYATDGADPLTALALEAMRSRLPTLSVGETMILVETVLDYEPLLNIGLSARTLRHVIPTRPRFAPQLLFAGGMS